MIRLVVDLVGASGDEWRQIWIFDQELSVMIYGGEDKSDHC